ncbi:MAG: response regulator [Planctomycetes bacterium]|nr:response regulator [Planctomycetota bacterium]
MTPNGQSDGAAPRVLIADNDRNVTAILREFLLRRGLDVVLAEDGGVAMALLEAEMFDLFVCDLDMPVLGGDEILERVRQDRTGPPVVVISGYIDDDEEGALLAHPLVERVLRKPFDLPGFASLADSLARRGRVDRSAGPTLPF